MGEVFKGLSCTRQEAAGKDSWDLETFGLENKRKVGKLLVMFVYCSAFCLFYAGSIQPQTCQ
jgi:hypothetical protein